MASSGAQAAAWWRSWRVLLLSAVFVPPIGLVLLWLRPGDAGASLARRALGLVAKIAVSLALVVLTVTYMLRLGILHMEMSGAGWKPILSFRDPKSDEKALERHRAQQRASAEMSALAAGLTPRDVSATVVPDSVRQPESGVASRATSSVNKSRVPTTNSIGKTVPGPVARTYWTDFRGPNRDGVYAQTAILTNWPPEGLKVLWRQPIGGGYASFTIANGKAYTIEQRRGNETVAAYDLNTGRELWTNAWPALFSEAMGGDGPRATPTWNEGRVYALGAAGELRCLDADTGKVLWSGNILSDNGASNLTWGMAASPLVVDDKLIVLPGGRNGRSVVAYNKRTGERVWSALNDRQAYTSPMLVTLAGKRQLLIVSGERILGLTVENGELLWSYPWVTMYGINGAQPIVMDSNQVFVSAGYDHGSVLLEISARDARFSARPVWENRNLKNRFNSSVVYQGHIYGFDEGIFACIDARTGERKWKAGRYGYGQMLLADGHLIVTTESGDLVLLRATPERHEELARFSAVEGKTWNHPAISDGVLLVRNAREMAAFRLAP